MKQRMDRLFARYGVKMQVEHEAICQEVHAMLQRITRESGEEPVFIGERDIVDERCWRYLGDATVPVQRGDRILYGEYRFYVRDAAAVRFGDTITHYWAVLRPESEAIE